MAYHFTVIC